MPRIQTLIASSIFFVVMLCNAATNNLEKAIYNFPKISAWKFNPAIAVRSANILIEAGKDSAYAALQKVATTKQDLSKDYEVDQKVCHLCRLLFLPKNPTNILREPMLGAPELLPLQSMKEQDWPNMPFAIVNDVPSSMTLGYTLEGIPERPQDYLAYCLSNGVFRTKPFPVPTVNTATNALNILLNSEAWKKLKWKDFGQGWSYDLSESYAKKALWKQVQNMRGQLID